jgi:Fibronectin type III domain
MSSNLLPFWCSCRSIIKYSTLLAAGLAGLSQPVSGQLTIQVVNDSGLSDTNIYIMVPGAAGATLNPQSLFVDKNTGTNASVALSTLATNSWGTFTLVSPISGNTNKVYSFQTSYISSGAIYFIYNNSFVFSNGITPSPSPDGGNGGSGYRYDYAELTYNGNNDVDLTYVDKFGIPLQLEWFHGTNTAATNLLAGSYVYASTKTLANLFAANGFANAVFSLTNAGTASGNITPGWQYAAGTNPYANFARIVSPEKASGTGASVSPYPGVTNYLNSLINHPFTLNGASVQGGSVTVTYEVTNAITTNFLYYYLGYQTRVATNNVGGWTFTLSYDPKLVPASYDLAAIGAVANSTTNVTATGTTIVVNLPVPYTNTMAFSIPDTNTTVCASALIYGAPVGTNYSVNGTPVTNFTHPSYSVEAWMLGDVLSALNFGFAGGIYGTNSAQWFSKVAWTSYPYGWAQPSPYNDATNGYFNPYAGLMYYEADAYTFAFSERITPDVGLPVESGDVIRITLLPDDRLDSPIPVVQTNLTTTNSITLSWNPVAGATGYRVNMLRPLGMASANITSTSHAFTGLAAGTPYVMSVQAVGTNSGNPIITPARLRPSRCPVACQTPFTRWVMSRSMGFNFSERIASISVPGWLQMGCRRAGWRRRGPTRFSSRCMITAAMSCSTTGSRSCWPPPMPANMRFRIMFSMAKRPGRCRL